jgi:hypothetical protein
MKYTSKSCNKNLESFTLQSSITVKSTEKVLFTSIQTEKYDNLLGASESKSTQSYCNGNTDNYESYSDKKCNIRYNPWNDTYQVYEYGEEMESDNFYDIFEDEEMKDIEKIIDAAIGNLKDYVIVEDNADGSKEFSGSLDDAQIPALVNAISSFIFKRTVLDMGVGTEDIFPKIQNDVYIKKITGKASVNMDGMLERIYGSCIISGKDKAGKSHDLTLEVLVRLYDINSTVVTKPDLDDKTVETYHENNILDMTTAQKYIGKYKQDIVLDKDNTFIKIGERIVEIEKIDNQQVSGKYHEIYKSEYAEYAKDKMEFDFDAKIIGYKYAQYETIDDDGRKKTVNINFIDNSSMIHFSIYSEHSNALITKFNDSIFVKIFED